ncbi:uncharacterized protein LOC106431569 [Brassica napus]|uniref:uncharacterized protein LOC106431569 n=1 Tax=Brassica napus TaxID=3708 RepID=UPI000BBF29BF|nr:uncharacterized protein LOC106431569 [Brassica napus]
MRVYFFKVCGLTDFTSFSTFSVLLQVRMCTYLLLVYGPVRSHLGFPVWRLRYTEIVIVEVCEIWFSFEGVYIEPQKQEGNGMCPVVKTEFPGVGAFFVCSSKKRSLISLLKLFLRCEHLI